jgi:predicted tellurium resistance membrane protein TerC
MKEDENVTVFRVIFLSIGSFLIGSEYSAALGWGIWFISMAID